MPPKVNLSGAGAYTTLGLTMALTTVGCFFLGWWIDGMIGTRPWLAIAGAFAGAAGGFINLVQTLNRLQAESEQKDRDDRIDGKSRGGGDTDRGSDSHLDDR